MSLVLDNGAPAPVARIVSNALLERDGRIDRERQLFIDNRESERQNGKMERTFGRPVSV